LALVQQQLSEDEVGRQEPVFGVGVPTKEPPKIVIDEACTTIGWDVGVIIASIEGVAELNLANHPLEAFGCRDRIRDVALAKNYFVDRGTEVAARPSTDV